MFFFVVVRVGMNEWTGWRDVNDTFKMLMWCTSFHLSCSSQMLLFFLLSLSLENSHTSDPPPLLCPFSSSFPTHTTVSVDSWNYTCITYIESNITTRAYHDNKRMCTNIVRSQHQRAHARSRRFSVISRSWCNVRLWLKFMFILYFTIIYYYLISF